MTRVRVDAKSLFDARLVGQWKVEHLSSVGFFEMFEDFRVKPKNNESRTMPKMLDGKIEHGKTGCE